MSETTEPIAAREPSAKYLPGAEPALVRGFGSLATAPGGVARLRELIRSLAVSGKLLLQDRRDQAAKSLLAVLALEKQRLIDAGAIRKDRAGDCESDNTLDFELPHGWELVRLADVAWPQAGFAFKSSGFNDTGHGQPLIRIRDVGSDAPTTFFSGDFRGEFIVRKGDWLIGMDGDFRVATWNGPDALLNQRVTRLKFFGQSVQPLYICLALQQELRKLQGTKAYTTVDHLSGGQIASRVIPLPPLAEQHRIVARVEELMKLCDALEQSGRLADEQHARLTSTLFDALAASESAHALAENWQRIAEHFDLLLDRPEAIDAFEQTMLQLAVRGLLVPQKTTDESATRLVPHSDRESVAEAAIPLPQGWVAACLPDLCSVSGGSTPSKAKTDYWVGHIPWVSPKDMKRDVIADAIDHVSEQALAQTGLSLVPTGSVLIVVRGMILAHSFPTAITSAPVTINQDMKALSPRVTAMAPYLALICRGFKREILSMVERSTHGTCKLESAKLFGWQFGIPPLAEQHRIVARVEELRRLCADLRQRLTKARETQSRLADALVAEVACPCPSRSTPAAARQTSRLRH